MVCPWKDSKRYAAVIPGWEDAHMPGSCLTQAMQSIKLVVKRKV